MCTCTLLLLSLFTLLQPGAASVSQNHRTLPPNARCIPASLPGGDFCAEIVTYPVPSTLLNDSDVLSPRHRADHAELVEAGGGMEVLSARARSQFDLLLSHRAELVRARAAHHPSLGPKDDASEEEAQEACEAALRKYLCNLHFPRCFDDPRQTGVDGRALELHVCYSACHAVRDVCGLAHRVDCRTTHSLLDHEWVEPSEHAQRFSEAFRKGQGYDDFFRVDCVDSPPSGWKYLSDWLVYGGPGRIALYTLSALVLYAILAGLLGLGREPSVGMRLAKIRAERVARRAVLQGKVDKIARRMGKLSEIKRIMMDAQEAEQSELERLQRGASNSTSPSAAAGSSSPSPRSVSPSSSASSSPRLAPAGSRASQRISELHSSLREREVKLGQLDRLLDALEGEIVVSQLAAQELEEKEAEEDRRMGLSPSEMQQLMERAAAQQQQEQQADEDDEDAEFVADEDASLLSPTRLQQRRAHAVPDAAFIDDEQEEEEKVNHKSGLTRR